MARARRANVAAKYQGKWEEFQQKNKQEKVTAPPPPSQPLTPVKPSNSSFLALKRKDTTSSNSPRRVSFHGLNETTTSTSSNSNKSHTKKSSFKTKQESQTKHPKVVKESLQFKVKQPLWAKQSIQQQSQPKFTSVPIPIIPITRSTNNKKIKQRQRTVNSTTASAISKPPRMETPSSNNVSVVARLRPMVPHETERGTQKVVHKVRTIDAVLNKDGKEDEEVVRVELTASKDSARKGASSNRELVKCFALDGVLEEHDTQQDVYKKSGAYKAVTQDLFRGFHCTILAYGQSGSGKTYTMGTTADSPASNSSFQVRGSDFLNPEAGVIQRACHDLFQQVEEQCMGDATVELSYLEIYNEEIRDLLSQHTSKLTHSDALRQQKERERLAQLEGLPLSPGGNSGLQIREDPSGEVFVQGKTSVAVTNAEQVIELMRLANAKRVVASTKLNDVSSRSHAICILSVTGTNSYDVTFQSRLTLVDLAGSERLSKTENTGWRAKEGININVGLFVLGLVISALTETRPAHKRHPPYRESKLTRILQNSLGGNARTIMIACCSPTDYHSEETVNTLRYATQARNIKNPAVANIVHDEHAEQVLQLQSENDQLSKRNMSLEEQIAEYEQLIRQISCELTHVKTHFENTTLELCEVKQDYQTTAEQLMEIQEDFKSTIDQHKKEKIEDVLKKQTRLQKRMSSGEYLREDSFLSNLDTPPRSLYGENSINTEPTADLTIGTTAVSPLANRLVPPTNLQDEMGEASVPQQEEEEDPSADEVSVPVSQVAPECDQSQAISLLTEHQEWKEEEEDKNPLSGDMDETDLSISKALEEAQDEMDSTGLTNSILAEHQKNEEGSLHSLQSLTTEVHDPLSPDYVEEEKKEEEEDACDSSYQQCKTSSKLYCNDSVLDKESDVMVEAIPVSMPYNDLAGVNLPSMDKSEGTSPSKLSKQQEENSLQSGTITQGSQATTASGKRKTGFKQFMSKFNCMSGAYGMVQNSSCTRPKNQVAQVQRL